MNLRKFAMLGLIVAGFFALAACELITTATTVPTTVTTTTAVTTTQPTTTTTVTTTKSNATKVQEVIDALTLGDISAVSENLTLPSPTTYGVVVTWATSNADLITTFGEVTIPDFADGDQEVTLTATVTLGAVTETKEFVVTVVAQSAEDFLTSAATAIIITGADAITANFLLPSLVRGATVTWASDNATIAAIAASTNVDGYYAVTITRPKAEEGGENTTVTLTATLTIGETSIDATKTIRVIAEPPATVFTSFAALHAASGLNDYVDVTGIVYAKFNGGYFLLDTTGDYLAVYTSAANYNAVVLGDMVRIKGLYKNYYTLFQISNLTFQQVISSGNAYTITPTVLENALDLKAIDAAADRVMHGRTYTITVTIKVLPSGYVDMYVGTERVGTIYSYSLTDSINAIKAVDGKIVTIDVLFYTLHPTNGVMVLFQGGAADIDVAVLTGQAALDADTAAVALATTSVGGQSLTLPKTGNYGSAIAWAVTTGGDYATINVANNKVTFANVTAQQVITLTATLTLAGIETPTTRVFTVTVDPITTSTIAQVRAMTVSAQLVQVEGIVYFFTNNSYYIADATGMLNIYTVPAVGMALGDRVVIVGTLAAYNNQIQITGAVVKETVSTGNAHVQTPIVYVPGTTPLVSGQTYTVTGTVAIRGTNNNVYIMNGDTAIMAIYYRSTINDSYNALKAQVGKQITFNGVYMYNGNDSNMSPAVPNTIFFVYQEGAAGLILPELTDAEKLAADLAALTIALDPVSGGTATLPALGGYNSAITWEVISGGATILTGVVTYPNVVVNTDVVLRATLTIGTETAVTKDFTVTVQALTLTDVLAARTATVGSTVYFKGIVTALVGNNAFIQDGTAGIYVYVGSNVAYQTILVVGNEVAVLGKTKLYSQLLEVDPVTSITLVQTGQPIPAAVELTTLVLADILAQQGKLVSIDAELTIKTKPNLVTGSSFTLYVLNGTTELQIRIDKTVAEFEALKTLLNALDAGQKIAFVNIPASQYNATPQLMLGRVDQIVLPTIGDIVVTPENFNTNKGTDYWGATTGWALSGADVSIVASVSVSLYDAAGNLLVTNTSKDPSKVNIAKQYSCAFIVLAGTYSTSSTWNFGTWIPTALVSPAKAVITVTDVNGFEYVAELTAFAAEEPSHPTWASLFTVADIVVTPENFNTNKGTDYWGATTGWSLSGADVAKVASISVALYDAANNLLVTNTSKDPSKVNIAKQYSCAFIVLAGTYSTSSTWNFGTWTPNKDVLPAKAVITVTDINGYTYVGELTAFLQEEPSHPTWESLFPVSEIIITPENFNTNRGTDYYGATTGWSLSGADVANVASVSVSLYDAANNLLVTNTSKDPSKVNIAKQYSCAFIVLAGTYSTSSTWNFGAWTPNGLVAPAKAVITVTDTNGYDYIAELTTFLAEEPSHPTWQSLFAVADIVVTPENFNTNKGTDYNGATTGWSLSGADVGKVILVTVELYDGANNLLVTNVSKEPGKVNIAKQYSCAFIVTAGTYSTSSTWNFGAWTPNKNVIPAKAVITVMDLNGFEYVAELTSFLQEEPSHPTWLSLFPVDLVVEYEFNFGTVANSGYTASPGRTITLTNSVAGESNLDATFISSQIGVSTYAPHTTGNAFAVMRIGGTSQVASIVFNLGTEQINNFTFDYAWWSPADETANEALITSLVLQVWNNTTSAWETVYDFASLVSSVTYTTVSIDINGASMIRLYGTSTATTNTRIAIDNVKINVK